MKQKVRGIGVGTISLIMIFSVLCLTIFAMLTLSTSNAEKALADRTSSFVKGYYEADSKATKIRAQIYESYTQGVFPASIDGVDITYEHSGDITVAGYYCKVNDVQDLRVKLRLEQTGSYVLEWKTAYSEDWAYDDSLSVWDPDIFELLF